MPRLVLHIGTHKTGTTSLQNHWHANRQALSQVGIVYPDLTPHSGHHGFLTDWIALPQVYALPKGGARLLDILLIHIGTPTPRFSCRVKSLAELAAGAGRSTSLPSERFFLAISFKFFAC